MTPPSQNVYSSCSMVGTSSSLVLAVQTLLSCQISRLLLLWSWLTAPHVPTGRVAEMRRKIDRQVIEKITRGGSVVELQCREQGALRKRRRLESIVKAGLCHFPHTLSKERSNNDSPYVRLLPCFLNFARHFVTSCRMCPTRVCLTCAFEAGRCILAPLASCLHPCVSV